MENNSPNLSGEMKTTLVAITLILAGTMLLMTPFIYGYLHEDNVAEILKHQEGRGAVTLEQVIDEDMRMGAMIIGTGMILTGILATALSSRRSHRPD